MASLSFTFSAIKSSRSSIRDLPLLGEHSAQARLGRFGVVLAYRSGPHGLAP
jgi:hypothetical protein